MKTPSFLFLISAAWLGSACSGSPADSGPSPEELATIRAAVIGGEMDTSHQAVVTLEINPDAHCTATIIATDPDEGVGYALTAAHCAYEQLPPTVLYQGDDYRTPTATYPVLSFAQHPDYDGPPYGSMAYDFGMLKIGNVTESTPTLPVMTPEEDVMVVDTALTGIGYGITDPEGALGSNTIRHSYETAIEQLSATLLFTLQDSGGACSGDSGGPLVHGEGASERVAAVLSAAKKVEPKCSGPMMSGRVSAVVDDFIQPFMDGADNNCALCLIAAEQSTCEAQVNACQNEPACAALDICRESCEDAACKAQCSETHRAGVALYVRRANCLCDDDCAEQCGADEFCTQCGFASGEDVCRLCNADACCEESAACAEDTVCERCVSSPSRASYCESSEALEKYNACLSAACPAECRAGPQPGDNQNPGGGLDDDPETKPKPPRSNRPAQDDGGCSVRGTWTGGSDPRGSGAGWVLAMMGIGIVAFWRRRLPETTAR